MRSPNRFVIVASAAALVACAAPARPHKPGPRHDGWSLPRQDPGLPPLTESARRFASEVERLEGVAPDRVDERVAAALNALTEALKPIREHSRQAISAPPPPQAPASDARSPDGAPRRPPEGTESQPSVATASVTQLQTALDVLVRASPPPDRRREFRDAITTASALTGRIAPSRPIREQVPQVVSALHATADALFVAHDAEAPFGETAGVFAMTQAGSFHAAAERVREAVLLLSQRKWTHAPPAAAEVLFELVGALDVARAAEGSKELITDIRYQAERLRRADGASFGQSGWMKAGLKAAVTALQHTEDVSRGLGAWIEAAHQAIEAIDARSSLAFQRATVQDAARATADLFVAAAEQKRNASSITAESSRTRTPMPPQMERGSGP